MYFWTVCDDSAQGLLFSPPYGGEAQNHFPPRVSEYGGKRKFPPQGLEMWGGKSQIFFGRLRRPIKISIFCRLFVPIFNVVSTAPGDILDTIECFSVVRNTLLSLATPNREVLMFFTQFHLVNDSKIYLFTPAVGKNYSVFSFMLVYRTQLGKHKTLNVGPPQARKNYTLGALLKGFTLKIARRRCRNLYVSKGR